MIPQIPSTRRAISDLPETEDALAGEYVAEYPALEQKLGALERQAADTAEAGVRVGYLIEELKRIKGARFWGWLDSLDFSTRQIVLNFCLKARSRHRNKQNFKDPAQLVLALNTVVDENVAAAPARKKKRAVENQWVKNAAQLSAWLKKESESKPFTKWSADEAQTVLAILRPILEAARELSKAAEGC